MSDYSCLSSFARDQKMCPQNTFGWGFKLKLLSPASNLSNSVNALPPPNPAFVFPECSALEAVHSSVMCSSATVKCSCTVLPQFLLALRGSLDATISIHKSMLEPTYYSLSPAWCNKLHSGLQVQYQHNSTQLWTMQSLQGILSTCLDVLVAIQTCFRK